MDPLYLLQRMASISPGALLHLTGRTWLENIDEDNITHQMLVNECFAVMIGEAYELGIEFYCTLSDLCESLYTIDKTLLLFEVVFPTPLYRSITEDESFKKLLSSIVLDSMEIEGETSIQTLLEQLGVFQEKTTSIFKDTYLFLHDKMKSTPVFDAYVRSTFDIDNTPMTAEINNQEIAEYLNSVQTTFQKLLKAADLLYSKGIPRENFVTIYDSINEYKTKAIDPITLDDYTWMHHNKNIDTPTPMTQLLLEKFRIQFTASVPLYEEYYILRDNPVLITDVPSLLLGIYITTCTKDNFLSTVTDTFNKLQANGKTISNDMLILIQNISLILVREYYN